MGGEEENIKELSGTVGYKREFKCNGGPKEVNNRARREIQEVIIEEESGSLQWAEKTASVELSNLFELELPRLKLKMPNTAQSRKLRHLT